MPNGDTLAGAETGHVAVSTLFKSSAGMLVALALPLGLCRVFTSTQIGRQGSSCLKYIGPQFFVPRTRRLPTSLQHEAF